MTPRSPLVGRGLEKPAHPRRTPAVAARLVVLTLTVLIASSTPSQADLVWEQLWADDFEYSMDPRWSVETFEREDRLEVAQERTIPKCYNKYLAGYSPDRPGCGFVASTPTLAELGLDPMSPRYVIRFRYRMPSADFCWTLPLASPDITLIASECSNSGRAKIGVAANGIDGFRRCAELEIGLWHDFRIVVDRNVFSGVRVARVYVNGDLVTTETRTGPALWPNVTFMDLPVRPISSEEGEIPSSSSCFGSGNWDDVRILALQPVEPDGGRRDDPDIRDRGLDVYPNPANPATVVRVQLDRATRLTVRIHDVRGRSVRDLHSGVHPAGEVAIRWKGDDDAGREVASGVYVIRATTSYWSRSARVVLAR